MFSIGGCGDDDPDARKSITKAPSGVAFSDGDFIGFQVPVTDGTTASGDMTFTSGGTTLTCDVLGDPWALSTGEVLATFCEDMSASDLAAFLAKEISVDSEITLWTGNIDASQPLIVGIYQAGDANGAGQTTYTWVEVTTIGFTVEEG
jgi:hypothetical protein